MEFKHTRVYNIYNAVLGARHAWESQDKSDSSHGLCGSNNNTMPLGAEIIHDEDGCVEWVRIGSNDLDLCHRLIKAGSCHRKFLRQIFVNVDITAPIYWWKEFDTYKVGTVRNSTGTMHTLSKNPITKDCFEMDDMDWSLNVEEADRTNEEMWNVLINYLECLRVKYLETKDKTVWKELIRLLPSSWLQTSTITMSYETILAMCSKDQRRHHKLTEWSKSFIGWARTLPYAKEFLFPDEYKLEDTLGAHRGSFE